jgi:hypothetical protein
LTLARNVASSQKVKRLFFLLSLIGLFGVLSCGAKPLLVEETDLVATIQDEGRNYSSFRTYVLVDEVGDLCLQPTSGPPSPDAYGGAGGEASADPDRCDSTEHSSDEAVLEALARNMEALGYERVSEQESESADVLLLTSRISRESWNLSLPYCYPSSYYRGCVEPISDAPVTLLRGSLLVQLIDLEASSGDELVTTWTAAVDQFWAIRAARGTSVGEDGADAEDTIMARAIDDAFEQSSYLGGEQ